MWLIYEHRNLAKRFARLPREILKRYEKWKDIISVSGPSGLRMIKGLHDEALKGEWQGYRSSRLNVQFRVIYKILEHSVMVQVIDITAHDYRRK